MDAAYLESVAQELAGRRLSEVSHVLGNGRPFRRDRQVQAASTRWTLSPWRPHGHRFIGDVDLRQHRRQGPAPGYAPVLMLKAKH